MSSFFLVEPHVYVDICLCRHMDFKSPDPRLKVYKVYLVEVQPFYNNKKTLKILPLILMSYFLRDNKRNFNICSLLVERQLICIVLDKLRTIDLFIS